MIYDLEDKNEIEAFYSQDSDRAVAILWGQIVENRLTDAIRANMRREKGDINLAKTLFHSSGALGSFGIKLDIAFLFGILPRNIYDDLVYVKRIRNAFAHQLHIENFETQQIRDWVNNLKSIEGFKAILEGMTDPARRFVLSGELSETRSRYRLCIRFYVHKLMQLERNEPKVWDLLLSNFPHNTIPMNADDVPPRPSSGKS